VCLNEASFLSVEQTTQLGFVRSDVFRRTDPGFCNAKFRIKEVGIGVR
jgi:hypothetical protein